MAPILGNLLAESVSSVETSSAGWSGSGCTLSRVSGSTGAPDGGSYILRATATGTADTVVTIVDPVPVSEGTHCQGYMWGVTASRAATVTPEIVWLDAADAVISVSGTDWLYDGVGSPPYRTSVHDVAPAGSVSAKFQVRGTNTSAGDILYLDLAYLGPVLNADGNLLGYDDYSSEGAPAPWTSPDGSIAWKMVNTTLGEGSRAVELTPDDAGILTATHGTVVPVSQGDWYILSTRVLVNAGGSPSASVTSKIEPVWRDEFGNQIEEEDPSDWFSYSNAASWVGVQNSRTRQAPPGASTVQLQVLIDHTVSTAGAYYFDMSAVQPTAPTYVLAAHPADGYISLDVAPITEVPGGDTMDRISIWRVEPDGARYPVRSYDGDVVDLPYTYTETVSVEDYEAPAGLPVWYWVQFRDSDGTGRATQSTRTVTAPAPEDPTYVWVKSPGLPALNSSAQVVAPVSWSRAARESRYDIVGRSSPVVRTDARASRTGSLQLYAWDAADHQAFADLLSAGLPVLIQAHQGRGMDGNLYASVGDASAEPIDGPPEDPSWVWSLELTEIARPSGALQGSAGRTWDDVEDLDEWADLVDLFDSWQAVLTG